MKILIVALIVNLLFASLSLAKRRRTSRFKREHALVLNTQKIFTYNKVSERVQSDITMAYAYNLGNFEFQPYIVANMSKSKSQSFSINGISIGADVHFNIIENRRGERWVPYILSGGAFTRKSTNNGFAVRGGTGVKYFVTSRFVVNPDFFFEYKKINQIAEEDFLLNINFRYYF